MSKRLSAGGGSSNTLFNYFTKTPPSNKKIKPDGEESESPTPSIPQTPKVSGKKTEKNQKRERAPTKSPEPVAMEEDDESPVQRPKKKRIRLYPVDSDDSDTENKADNLPATPKTKVSLEKKLQESFKYEPQQSPKDLNKKTPSTRSSGTPTPKTPKAEPKEDPEKPSSDEGDWIHCRLDWLKPDKIRDAMKRRPDHPEYDPRTLFVPEDFKKMQTPAHRQWWDMKASHYDCVLFFKVGKFYELFHMDAAVGVNELGFSYMRGEYAHSGFPESAYPRMASTLVSKGYKVARVEQTETPDMMQERCKRDGLTGKHAKVVTREICQVSCRGTEVSTLLDAGPSEPGACYLATVTEEEVNGRTVYGICFIDTSIGLFRLGQFEDDKHSSRLLTTFAHYPPALVVYERKTISARTSKVIATHCHSARRETVAQFWTPDKTLKTLAEKYYKTDEDGAWPEGLKPFLHEGDALGLTPAADCYLAVRALGGCVSYLTDALLDIQVLGMAQFERYAPVDILSQGLSQEDRKKRWEGGNTLVLDAITLRNLRIVGEEGSLYDKLNYCITPMGKRLLRQWVCSPTCQPEWIRPRQEAVRALYENQELSQDARNALALQPDLERLLAKLHTLGNLQRSKNHPDARAIFFEEKKYSKKKVQDFLAVINGFKSAMKIVELFSQTESTLLRKITQLPPDGDFPDYMKTLKSFEEGFNHKEAEKEGRIVPSRGVDSEYDEALAANAELEQELEEYRTRQEKHFKVRVSYVGSDKKRFQLEVAESAASRATPDHQLEGARKGYKRYSTPTTRDLLARMISAEEQKTAVLRDLSRRIFEKFCSHQRHWELAARCLATLDVLLAFAEFARQQSGEICLPEFTSQEEPLIRIVEGRHPCLATGGEVIPNDTSLGGGGPSLLLLTGANMGGKSTLMRQVALIALTAHLGCFVPARECVLTPVDRIFTRLGASDDILSGQSTFLVEMSETAAIVRHATSHSLVLLDELGRGTSTHDGCALASGVVSELAARACRVVFSTHYRHLVRDVGGLSNVLLGHMACMVETEESTDDASVAEETVTFLYKLAPGASPRSYGFNAARLAGVPAHVTRRARALARDMEHESSCVRAVRELRRLDGKELREMLQALKI